MELNFPSSYHVNWLSCLVHFPIEEACYHIHLKEQLTKYPKVFLREAYLSPSSSELECYSSEEMSRLYYPYNKDAPYAQYALVKTYDFKKSYGLFIVVNLSPENSGFYHFKEKLQSLVQDPLWDSSKTTYYFFNIHSRVNPQEILAIFENYRQFIQILTPYYHILPFDNIFSSFKDFSSYKVFDWDSSKLVYMNSLYLWALEQGGEVDAYQHHDEWKARSQDRTWTLFKEGKGWSLYHTKDSFL